MSSSVDKIYKEALEPNKYKVFIQSLLANCLDIFFIVIFIALTLIFIAPKDSILGFIAKVIIPFIPLIYHFVVQSSADNSIGRHFLNINIVEDGTENNIDLIKLAKRECPYIISIILLLMAPLILKGGIFDHFWYFSDGISSQWSISVLYGTATLYLFWLMVETITMAISPSNKSYKDHIGKTRCVREL